MLTGILEVQRLADRFGARIVQRTGVRLSRIVDNRGLLVTGRSKPTTRGRLKTGHL